MLRAARTIHGSKIHATDGEVGSVDEFLFDDDKWTVRYLIVDTGNWLIRHKVLISPVAVGKPDWERRQINVNLTRKQIEDSPGVETDEPVSRRWERDYFGYYTWPYYWGGMNSWGPYVYPGGLASQPFGTPELRQEQAVDAAPDVRDDHVRSTKAVTGYGVSAIDGHIGHVQDFILDDETWTIHYLAVDTRDWWPGKRVLLPLDRIENVCWPDGIVTVDLTREQVRDTPQWESDQPFSKEYEYRLSAYFQNLPYRDGEQLKTTDELGGSTAA